jgi:hypothetical protein
MIQAIEFYYCGESPDNKNCSRQFNEWIYEESKNNIIKIISTHFDSAMNKDDIFDTLLVIYKIKHRPV